MPASKHAVSVPILGHLVPTIQNAEEDLPVLVVASFAV
jgi:hypothetical protein